MQADGQAFVYILASAKHGTLYIGVTSDLMARLYQHREGVTPGFASRHGVSKLVYFEEAATIGDAIAREKQLKKWQREWKINLIERANPEWIDLAPAYGFGPATTPHSKRHSREGGNP